MNVTALGKVLVRVQCFPPAAQYEADIETHERMRKSELPPVVSFLPLHSIDNSPPYLPKSD